MRASKESEWRFFGLVAFVAVFSLLVIVGCASARRDPYYDLALPPVSGDSTTFIRLKVENLRTQDAADPRLSLFGTGVHSLGTLKGINGKIERFIDTRWLTADGCVTIVAHYTGLGDLVFSKVCWRPGEMIEATLLDHFDPNTAWSHR